jgi:putative DNA primase/helicase
MIRPVSLTASGWVQKGMAELRVLYCLPEVLIADRVYVCEGEKAADAAKSLGVTATTSPHGSKSAAKADWSPLAQKDVIILPDNDPPGERYASDVTARALACGALSVRILRLPELSDGGDVFDFVVVRKSQGKTSEQIRAEIEGLVETVEPEPVCAEEPPDSASEIESNTSVADEDDGTVRLGERDPITGKLLLSPTKTLPTATAYVSQFHSHPEGRTLHAYGEAFWEWTGNRYRQAEELAIRHRLQPWLHEAARWSTPATGKPRLIPFNSNPTTIGAALESIRSLVHLPESTPLPSWLGDSADRPPANEILACRTMNLHVPTRTVLPATPALFAPCALDFDYDPLAPPPAAWLAFLEQIFGNDVQAIELLQEMMGYLLTGDTRQQKMFLIIGPRRSGKGTIGRILGRLIGSNNVVNPTLTSLGGPFGLQPIIGKLLAIMSDAKFTGPSLPTAVERLLSISGEDPITIERKFHTALTLKVPTRFVILTNDVPTLADSSAALPGRFMVMRLTKSFYGREDTSLTQRLVVELPGLLLWAIEGYRRLLERGHFVQPDSSAGLLEEIEMAASPVGTFVSTCCVLGPERRERVDTVFGAWSKWRSLNCPEVTHSKQSFGRELASACSQVQRRRGTDNVAFYEGIALREDLPC